MSNSDMAIEPKPSMEPVAPATTPPVLLPDEFVAYDPSAPAAAQAAEPLPTPEQQASLQASQDAASAESASLAKAADDQKFRERCQMVKGLAGWIPPLGAALVAGDALSAFARGKDLCGDEKHTAQAIADSASAMIASRIPGGGSVLMSAAKEAGVGWVADKVADNYIPKRIEPMGLPYIAANEEEIVLLPFNDEIGQKLAARRAAGASAGPSMEIASQSAPSFSRASAAM